MSIYFVHAPWCGHCKEFMPTWKKVKSKFSGKLQIKEINSDKNPDAVKKFNVEGFPSVFYMKGNEKVEYEGDRSEGSLIQFFQEAAGGQGGGGYQSRRTHVSQTGGGDKEVFEKLAIAAGALAGYFFYLSRLG